MKRSLHPILCRFFLHEEIKGGGTCETYLHRWTLLRTRFGSLYVHRFVGDDWSRDLHDHPKRFISIGLFGNYLEDSYVGPYKPGDQLPVPGLGESYCGDSFTGELRRKKDWRAPWFRSFPPEHRHRLSLDKGECWTLVWVGRPQRDLGFWHLGKFVPWNEYVGSEAAHKMRSCD